MLKNLFDDFTHVLHIDKIYGLLYEQSKILQAYEKCLNYKNHES